jgi:hypothetical protein
MTGGDRAAAVELERQGAAEPRAKPWAQEAAAADDDAGKGSDDNDDSDNDEADAEEGKGTRELEARLASERSSRAGASTSDRGASTSKGESMTINSDSFAWQCLHAVATASFSK